SRALHRLCACRGAALCRRMHRGARLRRPPTSADGARRSALRAEARSLEAAHGVSVERGTCCARCGAGARMTTRPYAAARRRLSLVDKLYEVNWGLVLLIAIIATAGFATLYSVAGGHFSPWASPQILRFMVGVVILVVAALVDVRVWLSLAYPAYLASLILLI